MESGNFVADYERTTRSLIQPRNILIQRSTPGSFTNVSSRTMVTRSVGNVYGSGGMAGGAATSVTDQRKSEKREMQDLNERFAGYIEKVRFLEAQNKKLSDELDTLKSRWGKQTTVIKTMYQTDLDQIKRLLDDCEKETQRLQIQVASMEEKVDDLRRKLDEANPAVAESRDKLERQIHQISEIESEVHLLRLRSNLLDGDRRYSKAIITKLQENLNRARTDFDAQAAEHDAAEAKRLALEEELAFIKELHEQELRELAAKAYFDSTASNREYWKSEMSMQLKKLQEHYGEKIDDLQNEMSFNYTTHVQSLNLPRPAVTSTTKEESVRIRMQTNEMRTKVLEYEGRNDMILREIEELKREMEEREIEILKEIDGTKGEIITMKAEMEAITAELEALLDAKLSLEIEIATYKKLLEGETDGEGLKQVVDAMFDSYTNATASAASAYADGIYGEGYNGSATGFSSSTSLSRKITASSSLVGGRTSYQRNARGPVSIAECSPDGKFVILENTGKRREELGGFTLRRKVDGKDVPVYTFKADAGIDPHMKIKLWVKGAKPSNATASDIEVDILDWGTGQNITTQLFNTSGQDRASHIQKTLA
uniref:Filarin n=1 Tax=Haemopis marmorata TaxID=38567 RepID=Q25089_HAEMA|nr:filarin [Haemopis marmorata]